MSNLADAVLTEQCNQYSSCGLLSAYMGKKAVFNAEYHLTRIAFLFERRPPWVQWGPFQRSSHRCPRSMPVDEAGRDGFAGDGVMTKESHRSVADTVNRLCQLVNTRGIKVFAVIDHQAEARAHGLELRDTVVVIFGSPEAGTPVMASYPLAALDLPLKVLVWADGDGTKISFTAPSALATRYHLDREMARRLAGIDPLTDALAADRSDGTPVRSIFS